MDQALLTAYLKAAKCFHDIDNLLKWHHKAQKKYLRIAGSWLGSIFRVNYKRHLAVAIEICSHEQYLMERFNKDLEPPSDCFDDALLIFLEEFQGYCHDVHDMVFAWKDLLSRSYETSSSTKKQWSLSEYQALAAAFDLAKMEVVSRYTVLYELYLSTINSKIMDAARDQMNRGV